MKKARQNFKALRAQRVLFASARDALCRAIDFNLVALQILEMVDAWSAAPHLFADSTERSEEFQNLSKLLQDFFNMIRRFSPYVHHGGGAVQLALTL